jgi:NADH dehydrogenase (ubiquinone) flavoprotein 2
MGSQHRTKAEPAGAVVGGKWVAKEGGQTTLMGPPRGPYCRDLDAAA